MFGDPDAFLTAAPNAALGVAWFPIDPTSCLAATGNVSDACRVVRAVPV
jgi:hypothetical protein